MTPSPDDLLAPWAPFENVTTFCLMDWTYLHDLLNARSVNDLMHDVLLQGDFSTTHLEGFSAQQEFDRMDRHQTTSSNAPTLPIDSSSQLMLQYCVISIPRQPARVTVLGGMTGINAIILPWTNTHVWLFWKPVPDCDGGWPAPPTAGKH